MIHQYHQTEHQIIEHKKKTMTCDIGNPGPGLGHVQKCGG
jgi:hypothetical protein